MIALLEMGDAEMFVGVTSLCKGFWAEFAGEGLCFVGETEMKG